jgi:hypothetical protein
VVYEDEHQVVVVPRATDDGITTMMWLPPKPM